MIRLLALCLLFGCQDTDSEPVDAAAPTEAGTDVTVDDASVDANANSRDANTPADALTDAEASDAPDSGPALPIDLRPYWTAAGSTQTFRRANGDVYGWYRFAEEEAPGDFFNLYASFYDQRTPGRLVSWQKAYPGADGPNTATYGLLWFGDDGYVTEVGDWYNASVECGATDFFVPLGYRELDSPTNSGLTWSPPGGVVAELSPEREVRVFRRSCGANDYRYFGYDAYSAVRLVAHHDTWQAPYGRDAEGVWRAGAGRVYEDVVQLLFLHGTRSPAITRGEETPARCGPETLDPAYGRAALYRSFSNYETYAIEAYLARDVGYVQEALLFTESDYFNVRAPDGTVLVDNVCKGAIMGRDHETAEALWAATLDD